MYLGLNNASRFRTNGCVCQSAQNGQILIFFNNLQYKIKIQRGYMLWKKLTSSIFRGPYGGPFWLSACLLTGLIWANQFYLIILNFKSKIILDLFNAKSYWGPKMAKILFNLIFQFYI